MRTVLIAVLSALPVATAAAAPPPVPTVDHAVTMRLTGMDQPVQIRHRQGVQRMEMAMDGAKVVTLHEIKAGRMTMLQDHGDMKMAMVLDRESAAGMMPLAPIPEPDANATKVGQDKVAGHPCTVWRMQGAGDVTDACVTDQGVLLRVSDPTKKQTIMEATAIAIGPQDPALFTVPPGYQRMQMPGMGAAPVAPRAR